MRVVHISYSYKGGAGRAAWRLHEALLEAEVDSWFLTMDSEPPQLNRNWVGVVQKEGKQRGNWYQLQGRIRDKRRFTLRKQVKAVIPKIVAECVTHPFSKLSLWEQDIVRSADVINLHWASGALLDYDDFFRNAKKPIVWTLHDQHAFLGMFHYSQDMHANSKIAGEIDHLIQLHKKHAIAASNQPLHVVAPSAWLKNEARNADTFKKYPVTQIPYSLNLDVYTHLNKGEARRRLGLPVDGKILLFVADKLNNYRKGFDLLHAALNNIDVIEENYHLVAIGKSAGITIQGFNIVETGVIDSEEELATYYNASDAFVLPSREDNLPNVMLESLACGTPVIGFSIGGVAEHIRDGINGYLAYEVSSEALGSVLEKFLRNTDAFNPELIRDYAVQRFSNELQASSYIDVYQSLLHR